MRRLLAAVTLTAAASSLAATPTAAASARPPIHHVWLLELENKGYSAALAALPPLGQILTQSYAVGHASLDNYVAQVSGQAPNALTQSDCIRYTDVLPGVVGPGGQTVGEGCVYPKTVQTLADQLVAAHLTWKGYMEDMGNSPSRDHTDAHGACGHPVFNTTDGTQTATSTDQYATRHDPFMYFHSILDGPQCAHVVGLAPLAADLAATATTPNFSWITPNLCNDGHDTGCAGVDVAGKKDGGIVSTKRWLAKYLPMILASPAYRADGAVIITWDESDTSDTAACCGEGPGPGSPLAGITGPGGGHIATVVISRYTQPGSTNPTPYNHYSVLRSIEDIFGVPHLAAAGASGLRAFGSDVFNAAAAPLPTNAPAPTPPSTVAARAGDLPVTGATGRWPVVAALAGALGVGALAYRRGTRRPR
ncbi:MAG: alkaline phosphatase family protein [Acidimicrobiales bacterium]